MGSLRIVNCLVCQFNHSQTRYSSVLIFLSSVCAYNVNIMDIEWRQISISGWLIREISKLVPHVLHYSNPMSYGGINIQLWLVKLILNYILVNIWVLPPSCSLEIQRRVRHSFDVVLFTSSLFFCASHGTWYTRYSRYSINTWWLNVLEKLVG